MPVVTPFHNSKQKKIQPAAVLQSVSADVRLSIAALNPVVRPAASKALVVQWSLR